MTRCAFFLLPVLLAGCAVGPDYQRPPAPVPTAYKELKGWTQAHPADAIDRGAWWSVYQDPVLDRLERQIDIGNQNLRAYEAAYRKARAMVAEARANYFPTLSASGSGERQRESSGTTANTRAVEGSVSWDLDLWGKVRRQVESDQAAAEASAAELASIRLSAQADLATYYFELRYQDQLTRLLTETVAAYQRSLDITRNQYAAGVAARSDVITAETQLKTTQSSLVAAGILRAQYEHAIAILMGKPPAELTIAPGDLPTDVAAVPVQLPSTLLQRRPDIAQAERTMREENALIGVETAAYYPDISLSADFGYSSVGASLFKASNQIWSLAASGSETIFDAGSRSAAVEGARADYDQAVANYRQTVLTAFQDVEDGLSGLRILADQAKVQAEAVASARDAVRITLNEYRAGTVAYTSVVTAQATALSDEETALQIRESRMTTHVSLIKALGGGWSEEQMAKLDDNGNPTP
jgi:NodT family efflux transporter outer membrane factor (OMF) lipoprotein